MEKSTLEKVKTSLRLLAYGLVLCPAAWLLWTNGYRLYGAGAGVLGVFALIASIGGSLLRAACPYCGANVDSILNRDEGRRERCLRCFEYSVVKSGVLRPLDPLTKSETPVFESPIFKDAVWPKGCVACGAAPVRCDDLSKTTIGLLPALVGHVQVVRGSVSGIPYCSKHRDVLALKVDMDKKLYLAWTSLRMMRRYLAANLKRPVY